MLTEEYKEHILVLDAEAITELQQLGSILITIYNLLRFPTTMYGEAITIMDHLLI